MDALHVADFLDAIKNNRRPNCDVESGITEHCCNATVQYFWRVGRDLKINPENGHILNDKEAENYGVANMKKDGSLKFNCIIQDHRII